MDRGHRGDKPKLILACLAALVAGCSVVSPIPSCPTGDAYDYLACVKPSFPRYDLEEDEFARNMVSLLNSYCEEDAALWLPVLEKSVRASLPEVKEFIESGQELDESLPRLFTLEEQAMESLDDQGLYRAVVAMYVWLPMVMGSRNLVYLHRRGGSCVNPSDCRPLITGSCVRAFEHVRDGNLIEFMKE